MSPSKTLTTQALRQISFRENDEIIGESKGLNYWSHWIALGPVGLFSHFNRNENSVKVLDEQFKKAEAKDPQFDPLSLYPSLRELLELYTTRTAVGHAPPRIVMLMDEESKTRLTDIMLWLLTKSKHPINIRSDSRGSSLIELYRFSDSSSFTEVKQEFNYIRTSKTRRLPLLWADATQLNKSDFPYDYDTPGLHKNHHSDDAGERDSSKQLSRWALMASEGKASSLADFEEHSKTRQVPMLIFATPKEWEEAKAAHEEESNRGVFSKFTLNYQFLNTPWTLHPPGTDLATEEVKTLSRAPFSIDEQRVFPNLDPILHDAAHGTLASKPTILIVPDGISTLVSKMILNRWATSRSDPKDYWNFRNSKMQVYQMTDTNDTNSQHEILEVFDAMRGMAEYRKVVLLGNLSTVLRLGRPINGEDHKNTYIFRSEGTKSNLIEQNANGSNNTLYIHPHALWLTATEGKPIKPSSSKAWSLDKTKNRISTILIGTENEWQHLMTDASEEQKYIDFKKHFNIVHLESPTVEIKFRLLDQLFQRPEVKVLGYEFVFENSQGADARRHALYHVINRTDGIAMNMGHEPVETFIEVYTALKRVLLEDIELRRSRTISRNYLDRFFSKVFPLPLSLNTLEPDDYLVKLSQTEATIRKWREMNVGGPNELKRRIIGDILSQTRPAEPGRPVQSSIVFLGSTGTGKSYLMESLIPLLGLVPYDHRKPNNEDADVYLIKLQNVSSDAKVRGTEKVFVDDVIADIMDLLSQPKGSRSFLFFDYLHKAEDIEIYRKIMCLISLFFDAQKGMIQVKSKKGDVKKIPVQNITIMLTLNQEPDADTRRC
jgi:hypothetical protein